MPPNFPSQMYLCHVCIVSKRIPVKYNTRALESSNEKDKLLRDA